jgi:antigen 43
VALPLTTSDLTLMNVLGWNLSFNSDTVPGGVTDYVSNGVTSTGITVLAGGILDFGSGGIAEQPALSGGTLIVESGGATDNATIDAGGNEYLDGTEIGATINSGGQLTVSSGGGAFGVKTENGGGEIVSSGGSDTTRPSTPAATRSSMAAGLR